jgi:hypothetical protein
MMEDSSGSWQLLRVYAEFGDIWSAEARDLVLAKCDHQHNYIVDTDVTVVII